MKYFNKTNLSSGSIFVVKPNDVKEMPFSNGSKGYFSYILGSNDYNHNIIYNNIILIKKGLKGKDRLSTNTLITPFYTCKNEEINNLILTKEYPYIPITSYEIEPSNINNFTAIEFFGWLLSIIQLNKKMDIINNTKYLNELNPNNAGKQLFIFEYDNLLIKFYNTIENPNNSESLIDILNVFFTNDAKSILISELREQNNLFMLPYYNYILNTYNIENNALEYIKNIIKDLDMKEKKEYITELELIQNDIKEQKIKINDKITSKLKIIRKSSINNAY